MTIPVYDNTILPFVTISMINTVDIPKKYLGNKKVEGSKTVKMTTLAKNNAEIEALYLFWRDDCKYGIEPFLISLPIFGMPIANYPNVLVRFSGNLAVNKENIHWTNEIELELIGTLNYTIDINGDFIVNNTGSYTVNGNGDYIPSECILQRTGDYVLALTNNLTEADAPYPYSITNPTMDTTYNAVDGYLIQKPWALFDGITTYAEAISFNDSGGILCMWQVAVNDWVDKISILTNSYSDAPKNFEIVSISENDVEEILFSTTNWGLKNGTTWYDIITTPTAPTKYLRFTVYDTYNISYMRLREIRLYKKDMVLECPSII